MFLSPTFITKWEIPNLNSLSITPLVDQKTINIALDPQDPCTRTIRMQEKMVAEKYQQAGISIPTGSRPILRLGLENRNPQNARNEP